MVVLHNISHSTSGNFKCEVLADHPSFEKDSEITYMEVVGVSLLLWTKGVSFDHSWSKNDQH